MLDPIQKLFNIVRPEDIQPVVRDGEVNPRMGFFTDTTLCMDARRARSRVSSGISCRRMG